MSVGEAARKGLDVDTVVGRMDRWKGDFVGVLDGRDEEM